MQFTIAGEEYRLKFRHSPPPAEPETVSGVIVKRLRFPRFTECFVERRVSGVWVIVTVGEARCSVKDNFSKEVGRRLSLKRALSPFCRPDRAAASAAYFGRTNTQDEGKE